MERWHTLAVYRSYKYIGTQADVWEHPDFTATVWSFTRGGSSPQIHEVDVPPDYDKGLLSTVMNGHACTLETFDEALVELGYTRDDILNAVRSAGA